MNVITLKDHEVGENQIGVNIGIKNREGPCRYWMGYDIVVRTPLITFTYIFSGTPSYVFSTDLYQGDLS